MSDVLTCRELSGFLMDYLDGVLDAATRARFDAHLQICPMCVDYLANYQRAVRLGRDAFAGDDPVPADVPEELVRAVLAARPKPS